MKTPKISILLPAYKSEDLLQNIFFPSLKDVTLDIEVIIFDNGGNGQLEERRFIRANDNSSVIDIVKIGDGNNIGLNPALNKCAEIATGEYFFLPHSDMFMMKGCLEELIKAAKNQPPLSFLLCSRSIEPTQGHTTHHLIKNYGQEANEFQKEKLLEDFKNYKDNTVEVGARMPFFMHRKLWHRMNGVDPNYFSYCTDDDLIQEAYHCGVRKFHMVYNSLVYHLQGKSNSQQKIDKDSDKPYLYFVEKWKKRGYPDATHPGQWHPKLIPFYTRIK